jgi:hypothetical protein
MTDAETTQWERVQELLAKLRARVAERASEGERDMILRRFGPIQRSVLRAMQVWLAEEESEPVERTALIEDFIRRAVFVSDDFAALVTDLTDEEVQQMVREIVEEEED